MSFFVFVFLIVRNKIFKNKNCDETRILVYHSIIDVSADRDPMRLTTPPELFEKQLRYLISSKYKIISMDKFLDHVLENTSIIGKKVVLTFDDGFDTAFEHGYRILKKYKLPATYFIVVNYIDSRMPLPWIGDDLPFNRAMSWDKVLEMYKEGIDIGSHSCTHRDLGHIGDDTAELYKEIMGSKKILENRLRVPISCFTYPFGCKGSYNEAAENIIRCSGYKAACINIAGPNKRGDNIFQLKRNRVGWDDNLFRFKMKLVGAYDWVDGVTQCLKMKI